MHIFISAHRILFVGGGSDPLTPSLCALLHILDKLLIYFQFIKFKNKK